VTENYLEKRSTFDTVLCMMTRQNLERVA